MMFASRRIRTVLGIGAALAVVAAIGVGVATASSASGTNRYVSATSSTGDVTQTYTATGTITRKNTSTASFATSGTVSSVKVAVGDQVEAGQVLATLDARALKLALLQAETTVAQAELNLYNAKHPSSSSSTTKSSSTSSTKKTTTTTSDLTTVTFNLTTLNEAVSAVNLAVVTEAKTCDAIMAWVNEEVTGSVSTTKTGDSSTESPSAEASATPTAAASASSEVSTAEASASPTATATQYAATADPTEDDIKACATARASLIADNTTLQAVMVAINAAANPSDDNSSPSGSSSSSSSSSSTSVSASTVAAAKATLLSAEQKLAAAKSDLADAELVAPISGTVGTVGLTKGESSSSGSVTIVGTGNAVATFTLPLTTRQLVKVGAPVTVTPAGSSKTLTGKITWISALETSGTSGSTATYSTTVAVTDPDSLLYSGSKASVLIPVKSVTSVVRVPASAVTPTGTGTATVQTLTSAAATSATTVTVQTGAVGGGWVQITSGLNAGQLVVLADTTEAIPTTTTNNSRRSSSSSSSTRSSASATALPSTSTQATSQPSSEPTK
jgi:HlyD family secretion protein